MSTITTMRRIMVINWKWSRDSSEYPSSFNRILDLPAHTVLLDAFQAFIKEPFELYTDPVRLKEGGAISENDIIIPIRVDTSMLRGNPDRLSEEKRFFLEKLDHQILENYGTRYTQILYLSHTSYNFQEREVQNWWQNRNIDKNRKFFCFGNAKGALYNLDEGLLDFAEGKYRERITGETSFFEQDGHFDAVKQSCFEYVWSNYWYNTPERLMGLRASILESMLETATKNEQIKARNWTANFLHYAAKYHGKSPTVKVSNKFMLLENQNFQSCRDLKKYTFKDDLINMLELFSQKEALAQSEKSQLATALTNMVRGLSNSINN